MRRVDVSARIANPTDKTFVFPQGDFTLKVTKPDGSLQTHTAKVDGGYFELGPGGEATATFSFTPTQRNGNYSWSGETWYYEK
ncbi:MAG TPA: hypothetical protein VNE62_05595 [Actinomycetota bacterium]|nr:hypothetical protein [Actinomycetota bacterium]